VAQRRTHVERAACLALVKHVVTAQVNLGGFAGSSQLLQVTIAEFSLFVFLVANGLRVGDPFRNGDGFSGCHGWCAL
jgi:hypothetical protein